MNITVTGYFGSGSSAAMDLLLEYSTNGSIVKNKAGGYEHTTLYHPGGIFDLEGKLLYTNDMHRSDEALRTFKKEMMRLNNYNFGWYGSFKVLLGSKFEKILNEFLNNLNPYILNAHYYGQCSKVIFNPFKIPLQIAARVLLGRTVYVWGRQFVYNPRKEQMNVCLPTKDEFYESAKRFINAYMNMFREQERQNILFDRLLLCQHLDRIPLYFDDNFRVIRVRRDVRDLYVLSNYLWKQINSGTMYPLGLDQFCSFWERLKSTERQISDARILTINFEDLIYKYDETVAQIEKHCDLSPNYHVDLKRIFKPEKSIKNTQVFLTSDKWKDEVKFLEEKFPNDIYDFPYPIDTDISQMFDDSTTKRKKGLLNRIRF